MKFDQCKTGRLDPIKRTEQQDFFDTAEAVKATSTLIPGPSVGFTKENKHSFAAMAAKHHKVPGAGTYKISDKAFNYISYTSTGRKR